MGEGLITCRLVGWVADQWSEAVRWDEMGRLGL